MKNTGVQKEFIIKAGLIIWIVFSFIGLSIILIKTKPIDKKFKYIDKLSNVELIKLSEQAMNLPIFMLIEYAFVGLLAYILYYSVIRFYGFNQFASVSVFIPAIAGIVGVAPLMFFVTGFLLRDTNEKLAIKLEDRKLKSNPKKISFRFKVFFAFGASIMTMTFWLLCFGLYYSINSNIDSTLESYQFFQKNLIENWPDELKNEQNINEIIKYIGAIKFDKNGVVMLADLNGKLIYQSKEIKLYVKFWDDINNKLKNDFKQRNADMFYENVNGNLISYIPINRKHTYPIHILWHQFFKNP